MVWLHSYQLLVREEKRKEEKKRGEEEKRREKKRKEKKRKEKLLLLVICTEVLNEVYITLQIKERSEC